jgi:hypothetical protein
MSVVSFSVINFLAKIHFVFVPLTRQKDVAMSMDETSKIADQI